MGYFYPYDFNQGKMRDITEDHLTLKSQRNLKSRPKGMLREQNKAIAYKKHTSPWTPPLENPLPSLCPPLPLEMSTPTSVLESPMPACFLTPPPSPLSS